MTGRMVVAVRSGRELMGSVWVACPAPLTGAALTALADGARTVALHLLRSRASADLERQVESELVIRLLEGTADAATVASRLGLPHSPLRVIAVQAFIGAERDAALLLAFERATTGFGWSRPGRSALAGNTVYTLLPGEQAAAARRWVTGLRAALPDRVTVLAGISGPPRSRTCPRHATRPTSVWRCTRCTAPGRACGLRRVLGRHPAAAATHRGAVRSIPDRGPVAELRRHDHAQTPSTCRRCGPGWKPRATRPRPASGWEYTRTPCVTDCARWPRSPICDWTTPKSGWP